MPMRRETKTLVFDRPFGVLLCDESTDAVLFAGVVYEVGTSGGIEAGSASSPDDGELNPRSSPEGQRNGAIDVRL
jgi:hypothetical protein